MPVVAAAVVPHSPLLLPTVAKIHQALLTATQHSLNDLAAEWYAAKPEVVVFLTPHGGPPGEVITVHAADHYQTNFSQFGDLTTVYSASGALGIIHGLTTAAEHAHLPARLQTFAQLDYGSAIPALTLLAPQPHIPIIPIFISGQPDLLLRAAAVFHDFFTRSPVRSILVASGDFSRRQRSTHHLPPRPTAEERAVSSAIVAVDPTQLASVHPDPRTCGYGPTFTLLGTIQSIATSGTIRDFVAPLGVGCITASFTIHV